MIVIVTVIGCAVGALAGVSIACLLRRASMPWQRAFYYVAVVASVIPYILHYRYSFQYLARSGVERYSGLDQYMMATPVAASVVVVLALLVASVRPVVAAITPVAFGVVYWWLLVPLVYQETPATFVGLDNVPFIWLLGFSAASAVFLLLLSVLALGRRSNVGASGASTA